MPGPGASTLLQSILSSYWNLHSPLSKPGGSDFGSVFLCGFSLLMLYVPGPGSVLNNLFKSYLSFVAGLLRILWYFEGIDGCFMLWCEIGPL